MRRLPAPLVLALAATTLVLGGCTTSDTDGGLGTDPSATEGTPGQPGDDPDSPDSADEPTGPACTTVWKVGATLPDDYTECAAGAEQGEQDVTECQDDTRLIVFDNIRWAVTGGEVVEPDASPLQDTAEYGAAYSTCTGE